MRKVSEIASINPRRSAKSKLRGTFLGMTDVSSNGVDYDTSNTIAPNEAKGYTYFEDGDILIAKITPCFENGKTAWVTDLRNGFGFGSTEFHVVRADMAKVDPYFLYLFFRSHRFRMVGEQNMTGSAGQRRIPSSYVSDFRIPLPPLPAQRRIAAILQTWDRAITLAEQQLADLQERKRGLMQLLLTGKERLPGFEGAWEEVRLGEVSTFLSSNSLSRSQLTDDPASAGPFVIHYGDLHSAAAETIISDLRTYFTRVNEMQDASGSELRAGDVVISDASEDELGIGMSIELGDIGSKMVLPGLHTIALRPKADVFALGFLGYRLSETNVRNTMRRVSQGASVKGLSKTEVGKLSFVIPSLSEQRAIVSIMMDVDRMSDETFKRIANFRLQKKGLMQRLLEGETAVGEAFEKYVPHE